MEWLRGSMQVPWSVSGCIVMALAVALGTLGSYVLDGRLSPEARPTWDTALRYHVIHGIGLFLVDLLALGRGGWAREPVLQAAGWLLLSGLVLFSGSLYLRALTGTRRLALLAPLGACCWIVAWSCLAYVAWHAEGFR